MANPDFNALFKIYACKNPELTMVSRQLFEYGKTIAKEPSAALSSGLDEHAIKRQNNYVARCVSLVDALAAKPQPDMPASHPTNFPANLTPPYQTFVEDISGELVPINEMTLLLSQMWMTGAVELILSQSANLAGSLTEFDHQRAQNNLGALKKLLDEMAAAPPIDLPETSIPGSEVGTPGAKK